MADFPTGTVTFLFTDIQGSTPLWEREPEAMRLALARHDAILRQAVADQRGLVFKTVGDAMQAAFALPADAVVAALVAQRELEAAVWPTSAPLRVRMGLHTGPAELAGTDYAVTHTLNRMARIMAAAHGGQILLSVEVVGQVRGYLPSGVGLRDLGQHRMKGLIQREHLFQLTAPKLPAEFPPLATLDALTHNLPLQVTRFFGREAELAQLRERLAENRLLTLTGAGGVGKTRLALQVAEAVLSDFADGVWLVELAALADPALVGQAVAAALGVREEPGRPIADTLASYLRERQTLLVLDNCEHLLAACAGLAEGLLRACPRLRILASSREPLGVTGEAVSPVSSLSFPARDSAPPVDSLSDYTAVRLFVDRARLVLADFQILPSNAEALARICRRLDGIPLALEMAAARLNILTAEQLAERLEDAFHLLTGGSRTALPRQQTLRATIEWSHNLLSDQERRLLRRLAVFAGGWTLEAAETVCAGDGLARFQVLDVLASLAAKSVVSAGRGQGPAARYGMLETIRQYALEKLLEAGEADALYGRHLDYFLSLGEAAEPKLQGPEQMAWLARLDTELDNLRGALDVQRGAAGPARDEQRLRLSLALGKFWTIRNHGREEQDRLEAMLARGSVPARSLLHARLLFAASQPWSEGGLARARARVEASIEVFRAAGDAGRAGLGHALIHLSDLVHGQGDFGAKVGMVEESIALFRALGDKWGLADALHRLASIRDPLVNYLPRGGPGLPPPLPLLEPAARNDHTAERALIAESLTLFRETGDRWAQGWPLFDLGLVAAVTGERATARTVFEECLAIWREFGDLENVVTNLEGLGTLALADDDLERAALFYAEGLALGKRLNNELIDSSLHCLLAEVARRRGDHQQAAVVLANALAMRRKLAARELIAATLDGQARLAWSQGDFGGARALELEAFALRLDERHPVCLAHSFHALAIIATGRQQPARAARLFGAAASYHPALLTFSGFLPIWRTEHEASAAAIRAQVGEAETARLWAEGDALTLTQAVALALSDAG